MNNTKENSKYKTIGEVAQILNLINKKKGTLSTHTIRFWEKEFDILKPKKNKKGNRLFRKKDVENLDIIYHLVKERGFTLEGAKRKIKDNKNETIDNVLIIKKLQEIRKFLVTLRDQL